MNEDNIRCDNQGHTLIVRLRSDMMTRVIEDYGQTDILGVVTFLLCFCKSNYISSFVH